MALAMRTALIRTKSKKAGMTPFASDAPPKSAQRNMSVNFTPFCKWFGFTFKCQRYGDTAITRLFGSSGPLHISRLVMSIIVDTIQTVVRRRSAPDGIQKLSKILELKLYPATTINRVFMVCDFLASTLGALIGTIFNRNVLPNSLAMGNVACNGFLTLDASARNIASARQIAPKHNFRFTTLTPSQPFMFAALPEGIAHDREMTENFAGQVDKSRISWKGFKKNGTIGVGHFANSPKSWISNLAMLGEVFAAPLRAFSIVSRNMQMCINVMREVAVSH